MNGRLVALVVGAVILAAGGGCSRKPAPPPAAKPVVYFVPAIGRSVVEWDEYTGRLEATDRVEVRARVGGFLESVQFKDGQFVKEGDLLFVVDPRPYAARYEQVAAEAKQAEARLQLAQLNDQRTQKLATNKVIAQEEIDSRRNELLLAQAALQAAQAALNDARLDLEFTQVRAPIAGRIDRALVTRGNLVNSETVLTTIVSLDPIYCYFEADERAYLKYQRLDREGARPSSRRAPNPVELQLADETDFPHRGHMDFVENALDEQTSTIRGRAVFSNPDLQLTPGLFARVRLQGSGRYDAVLVPDLAIVTDQSNKFVNVVKSDGTVDYRPVTLGPLFEGLRIVRSGIAVGDKVITRGLQRVRPGAAVDAKPDSRFESASPAKTTTGAGA